MKKNFNVSTLFIYYIFIGGAVIDCYKAEASKFKIIHRNASQRKLFKKRVDYDNKFINKAIIEATSDYERKRLDKEFSENRRRSLYCFCI
jgi:hypothetical protein